MTASQAPDSIAALFLPPLAGFTRRHDQMWRETSRFRAWSMLRANKRIQPNRKPSPPSPPEIAHRDARDDQSEHASPKNSSRSLESEPTLACGKARA